MVLYYLLYNYVKFSILIRRHSLEVQKLSINYVIYLIFAEIKYLLTFLTIYKSIQNKISVVILGNNMT